MWYLFPLILLSACWTQKPAPIEFKSDRVGSAHDSYDVYNEVNKEVALTNQIETQSIEPPSEPKFSSMSYQDRTEGAAKPNIVNRNEREKLEGKDDKGAAKSSKSALDGIAAKSKNVANDGRSTAANDNDLSAQHAIKNAGESSKSRLGMRKKNNANGTSEGDTTLQAISTDESGKPESGGGDNNLQKINSAAQDFENQMLNDEIEKISAKSKAQIVEREKSIGQIAQDIVYTSDMLPVKGQVIKNFVQTKEKGIEIKAPLGTPVKSVTNGFVVFAGYDDRFGNLIIVSVDKKNALDEVFVAYSHMDDLILAKGDRVEYGTLIGHVGQTGPNIDMPKLRFAVRINQNPVDPLKYLTQMQP